MESQKKPIDEFKADSLILALELMRVIRGFRKNHGVVIHALNRVQMSVIAGLKSVSEQDAALEALETYLKEQRKALQATSTPLSLTQLH